VVCAFRGPLDAIVAVIGDCPAFEYCIAPSGLHGLVGENHHGVVYAAGERTASRLRALDGG
jgi:hypothetical protein